MRKFFGKFVFKPIKLKENVEHESTVHKTKIVCFSIAMGLVAAGYQSYYDNLAYRSS